MAGLAAGHGDVAHSPLTEAAVLRLVDVSARWQYRALRLFGIPLLRLIFRIEVRGVENALRAGPCVVAANHVNWLDAPLLLIAFPVVPRINFVADGGFLTESRPAWFAVRQLGGVLPVVFHGHASGALRDAVQACLRRGGSVGFFPEGEYGSGEATLERFHEGFAEAAISAQAPVVPAFISGTGELWLRKHVIVSIGEPIPSAGQTARSLTALTRERVAALRPVATPQRGPRLLSRLLSGMFHGRARP